MKPVLIKRQILRHCEADYITASCDKLQNLRQFFHCHPSAAGT